MSTFLDAVFNIQYQDTGVELIEPSTGRVVELKITEEEEFAANLCMEMLMTYAEDLRQYGVEWTTSCRKIQIVFPNDDMAENARRKWRES